MVAAGRIRNSLLLPTKKLGFVRVLPLLCLVAVGGILALITLCVSSAGISQSSSLRKPLSDVLLLHQNNAKQPEQENEISEEDGEVLKRKGLSSLPLQNSLSKELDRRNQLPPRNRDRFPKLARDCTYIVLYVHNRPQYLQLVVDSLSRVEGINETLLIVSHDGYFPEMNRIVGAIKFCQVKQIFAPYSPHLFTDSFPGVSTGDCQEKSDALNKKCTGDADQYGNFRSPRIVSLKHHWWWMMNWVWDGMEETRSHEGHILFIEEDHYVFPNAYRNIQTLSALKQHRCPNCYAANLAPADVNFKGEESQNLIAEKIGNVGYAFNRTVWQKIHSKAREFCVFDDYNWDITLWVSVYPSFGSPVYTLRGPRRSAAHFGKCGLHQGTGQGTPCFDNGQANPEIPDFDKVPNINPDWPLDKHENIGGYQAGFRGWGGWGDHRDHKLCLDFSSLYRLGTTLSEQ